MKLNMLEAKSQLSKLVKTALAGEEVIIASNGQAKVQLVPCVPAAGLRHWGAWAERAIDSDEAFSEAADAEVGRLFGGQ